MKRDLKTVEIKRLDGSDLLLFKSLVDLFNMIFEENRSNIGNMHIYQDCWAIHISLPWWLSLKRRWQEV